MSLRASQAILAAGLLSATALVMIGVILARYASSNAIAEVIGFDQGVNPWVIIFGLVGAHAIPLLLLCLAWWLGSRTWLGWILLILSPIFTWIGFDGLALWGEPGDVLLWVPYLATGLFMAIIGGLVIFRRFSV